MREATCGKMENGHFYGRDKFVLLYVTVLFADEVYCRETKQPEVESWSMSDVPVIVLVILLLLAILVGLACALRRYFILILLALILLFNILCHGPCHHPLQYSRPGLAWEALFYSFVLQCCPRRHYLLFHHPCYYQYLSSSLVSIIHVTSINHHPL